MSKPQSGCLGLCGPVASAGRNSSLAGWCWPGHPGYVLGCASGSSVPKALHPFPSGCRSPALWVGRSHSKGRNFCHRSMYCPSADGSRRYAAGAPETLFVVLTARLQARTVSGSCVLPLLLIRAEYQPGLPAKDGIGNRQLQDRAAQSHHRHWTGPASDQVPDVVHGQSPRFRGSCRSYPRGSCSRSGHGFPGLDNHR